MRKQNLRSAFVGITAIAAVAFCALCFFSARTSTHASASGDEADAVYFDILEDAVFYDDVDKRLAYDTISKTGVVNAASTSWINKDFAFLQYEKVQTPNGEKFFNECTTEFSVTYSDVGTLGTKAILLSW